jgi:carbamoylphosphate synthase large subunit
MDKAFDKSKTLELAKNMGIKVPTTHALNDLDEISELSKELKYPAIVKPKRSAYFKDGKGFIGEVTVQHNPGDLTGYAAKKFTESGDMPLIQRMILGREFGVELLSDKGDVRALSIHERIRSMSPRGGASVLKKTIGGDELSEKIKKYATDLARELAWHGVMMVEFKINDRTKEPVLMEINGRFWGSLPLAYFAGVDFPYMYYELAQGKQVHAEPHKVGVVSRHFLGDMRHVLRVLFSKDRMRDTLYPKRFDAVNTFFGTGDCRYDVIQKNDMMPFLMEIVDVINKATK